MEHQRDPRETIAIPTFAELFAEFAEMSGLRIRRMAVVGWQTAQSVAHVGHVGVGEGSHLRPRVAARAAQYVAPGSRACGPSAAPGSRACGPICGPG
jgi:hypothetical protein